jgi:hypothetical protein
MDFRVLFAKMDAAALIDSRELGLLICTSAKNISVMKCRGQLPATAFPGRKLNRWRVGVVRNWLQAEEQPEGGGFVKLGARPSDDVVNSVAVHDNVRRIGRPRKAPESAS